MVFEIGLGIVIGPAVLGIAHPGSVIVAFEDMGLSYLMFLAGVELDIPRIRGRSLKLAVTGWMISLALALMIASVLVVIGTVIDAVVMSLALTTTALGTLLARMWLRRAPRTHLAKPDLPVLVSAGVAVAHQRQHPPWPTGLAGFGRVGTG